MEEELKKLNEYYKRRRAIENDFNNSYDLTLGSNRLVNLNNKYIKLIEKTVNESKPLTVANEELFIMYQTAYKKVEEIMADVNDNIDIEKSITDSSTGISNKIKFYRHMNDLFLNVLVNRIGVEFGKKGEEKAILCRNIIKKNIENLRDNLI